MCPQNKHNWTRCFLSEGFSRPRLEVSRRLTCLFVLRNADLSPLSIRASAQADNDSVQIQGISHPGRFLRHAWRKWQRNTAVPCHRVSVAAVLPMVRYLQMIPTCHYRVGSYWVEVYKLKRAIDDIAFVPSCPALSRTPKFRSRVCPKTTR